MRTSETIDQITPALLKCHAAFPEIVKDAIGKIPLKSGGSYEYAYATLPDVQRAIKPILSENSLLLSQGTEDESSAGFAVVSTVLHVSGQWISERVYIPFSTLVATSPQVAGANLSYGKRYGAVSLFNLVTNDEDDDGAKGTHPEKGSVLAGTHQAPARQPAKPRGTNAATTYAGGVIPSKCPICDGPVWSNVEKKASGEFKPTYPDWSCRDKTCKVQGRRTAGYLTKTQDDAPPEFDAPEPEEEF